MDGFDDRIVNWFKYAQITSKQNDFSPVYEVTFIYFVTKYLVEDSISLGAEEKFFIQKFEDRVEKIYFHSTTTTTNGDEVEQKRALYEALVAFFNSPEIKEYERHMFQHSIRVTNDIMDWFKMKGNYRDTIKSLIDGQIEKPHLNTNIVGGKSLIFLLNYSDEIRWKNLSSLDDRDRLRVLLN